MPQNVIMLLQLYLEGKRESKNAVLVPVYSQTKTEKDTFVGRTSKPLTSISAVIVQQH